MPWLSKNSAMKLAGKLHICSGSADQTAEAWGTIRRSMKCWEKPCCSSQWPSEGAVPFIPISARASRLKRRQSRSIPRKVGLSRWAGRAKRPQGVPEYSKPAAPVGDREAHVRGLAGDPELLQQRFEVGVVAVVEDDEAGVDRVRPVLGLDPDRVRVPAEPPRRLVDDDLVLAVQLVGGHQAGDSGSDDRDLHRPPVRSLAPIGCIGDVLDPVSRLANDAVSRTACRSAAGRAAR